jgi:hypothetical protein
MHFGCRAPEFEAKLDAIIFFSHQKIMDGTSHKNKHLL